MTLEDTLGGLAGLPTHDEWVDAPTLQPTGEEQGQDDSTPTASRPPADSDNEGNSDDSMAMPLPSSMLAPFAFTLAGMDMMGSQAALLIEGDAVIGRGCDGLGKFIISGRARGRRLAISVIRPRSAAAATANRSRGTEMGSEGAAASGATTMLDNDNFSDDDTEFDSAEVMSGRGATRSQQLSSIAKETTIELRMEVRDVPAVSANGSHRTTGTSVNAGTEEAGGGRDDERVVPLMLRGMWYKSERGALVSGEAAMAAAETGDVRGGVFEVEFESQLIGIEHTGSFSHWCGTGADVRGVRGAARDIGLLPGDMLVSVGGVRLPHKTRSQLISQIIKQGARPLTMCFWRDPRNVGPAPLPGRLVRARAQQPAAHVPQWSNDSSYMIFGAADSARLSWREGGGADGKGETGGKGGSTGGSSSALQELLLEEEVAAVVEGGGEIDGSGGLAGGQLVRMASSGVQSVQSGTETLRQRMMAETLKKRRSLGAMRKQRTERSMRQDMHIIS